MSVFSGEFLGFQLGNYHSSNLNITRVSSGNRYTDNLIPTFKDIVAEVPGGDGMYYWNSNFSTRTFQIDFAYDNLSDEDLNNLIKVFSNKSLQPLIFDEKPDRKYMVKPASPPNLKYISFKDGVGKIYKGEGTINLIAYFPFAISTETFEWSSASASTTSNAGDLGTSFRIYYDISDLPTTASASASGMDIILSVTNDNDITALKLEDIKNIGTLSVGGTIIKDKYLLIDTKTHLAEGLDSNYQKLGNLYNRFITEGDFPGIAVGSNVISSSASWVKLEYNELYY